MAAAKRLVVSGLVQGVGYRASFAAQAHALQLAGWVRNRADGSVEAIVAGSDEAVNAIIAWAQRGPASSRVDHLAVDDIDDAFIPAGAFAIRATG